LLGGMHSDAWQRRAFRIVNRQECVVVLVEADPLSVQLLFEEGVTVEPISGLEGKQAGIQRTAPLLSSDKSRLSVARRLAPVR
jgi:hypothetical protein